MHAGRGTRDLLRGVSKPDATIGFEVVNIDTDSAFTIGHVEDWDAQKLELLAEEYLALRKEMWEMLATRVGERWAVVEAKVCCDIY